MCSWNLGGEHDRRRNVGRKVDGGCGVKIKTAFEYPPIPTPLVREMPGGHVASIRACIHSLAVRDHVAAFRVDAEAWAFLGLEIQEALEEVAANLKAVTDIAAAYWAAQAEKHHGRGE